MYKCILTLILPLFFMVTYPLWAQKEDENSFKLPEYKKFVMQNGLTIYLMEQHEVPLIYVSFVLPAGAIYDGDKSGLASLTAESLLFGTKNYSKKNIEEALDFIGAT